MMNPTANFFIILGAVACLLLLCVTWKTTLEGKISEIYMAFHNGFKVSLAQLMIIHCTGSCPYYLDMIDFIDANDKETDMWKRSKISVKVLQLGKTLEDKWENYLKIVDYARRKNVFVWMATTIPEHLDMEFGFYEKIWQMGYRNVGKTIATYHLNAEDRVNRIIEFGGHVRLVKGFYIGDIYDWDIIDFIYWKLAQKMVLSGGQHAFATHDFDLIEQIYHLAIELGHENSLLEFDFFANASSYVLRNMKERNIVLSNRQLYFPHGDVATYLRHHVRIVNWTRLLYGIIGNIKEKIWYRNALKDKILEKFVCVHSLVRWRSR